MAATAVQSAETQPELRKRRTARSGRKAAPAEREPSVAESDSDFDITENILQETEVELLTPPPLISRDGWNLLTIFLIACAVRLLWINYPTKVVFDEVHFGKFASKYIKHTMHMDVHPPLGKLLFTWAAQLARFDGSFMFENIGDDYLEPRVPYTTMRLAAGLAGVLVPLLAYSTVRNLGGSRLAAFTGGILVTFENALATQSRFILLDSFLICFTALSLACWSAFTREYVQRRPFSGEWWLWLVLTGASLGLTVSVKWVGLFVIATVGLATIFQLWALLGDPHTSWTRFGAHFGGRAIGLIVVPLALYAFFFSIHFAYLTEGGTNSSFLSQEFGETLRNGQAPSSQAQIGFGSKVVMRHIASGTSFLHSHAHNYPTGSKQQQITLYAFRDHNSDFELLKPLGPNNTLPSESTEFEPLTSGATVRLQHAPTKKRLHSHNVRPPLTDNEEFNEVSGYGFEDFNGDVNDHFRIVSVNPRSREELPEGSAIYSLNHTVRLYHMGTGCWLMSSKQALPEWGFKQSEVVCARRPRYALSLWLLESSANPFLNASAPRVKYGRKGFWGKFFEFNALMWKANQDLTGSHPFDSRPQEWPLLKRGIGFFGEKNHIVYLIGNVVSWWLGTFAVVLLAALYVGFALLLQRGTISSGALHRQERYLSHSLLLVMGWGLHIAPFFLMGRQLFLHHYLPSLYFALLSLAWALDLLVQQDLLRKLVHALTGHGGSVEHFKSTAENNTVYTDHSGASGRGFLAHLGDTATGDHQGNSRNPLWRVLATVTVTLLILAAIATFVLYSPLMYATSMSKQHCERLKIFPRWDFDCGKFDE